MLEPTLHKPIPMDSRVIIPTGFSKLDRPLQGTVVGIAMCHVVFAYIVLLDEPITSEYGPQRALSVPGSALETPDGGNFRL